MIINIFAPHTNSSSRSFDHSSANHNFNHSFGRSFVNHNFIDPNSRNIAHYYIVNLSHRIAAIGHILDFVVFNHCLQHFKLFHFAQFVNLYFTYRIHAMLMIRPFICYLQMLFLHLLILISISHIDFSLFLLQSSKIRKFCIRMVTNPDVLKFLTCVCSIMSYCKPLS